MEKINDDVFGELRFKWAWRKEFNQTMFGVSKNVELIVEGNDENASILNEQRMSFRDFQTRNSEIISVAEDAIFEYYQQICDELEIPSVKRTNMANQVELTGIKFPMVMDEGDISVGFLLECSWDPEHGLGVKMLNGKVEVSTQDLLT